jgi:hypothetical protein
MSESSPWISGNRTNNEENKQVIHGSSDGEGDRVFCWAGVQSNPQFSTFPTSSSNDSTTVTPSTATKDQEAQREDASLLEIGGLLAIKSNRTDRNHWNALSFEYCSIATIDVLFPKRGGRKGGMDPPPKVRTAASSIVNWRQLSTAKQQQIIADSTPTSLQTPDLVPERTMQEITNTATTTTTTKTTTPTTTTTIAITCEGISKFLVCSDRRGAGELLADAAVLEQGYSHLVGEALHMYASALSHGREWPVDSRLYPGALINDNTKEMFW